MFKFIAIMLVIFISCTTADEIPNYNGKFKSVYYTDTDNVKKTIKIDFIDKSKCKIIIANGNEVDDVSVYRYVQKGNWVMIKNMSTGKWTKLEYIPVDQNTFKLKLPEEDSVKTWRVFNKQKEPS